MPTNTSARSFRFSTFELNLDTGELCKQGRKVKLQEQPFQILAALLERPGEVVTREELRTRLWPADTFVDFDHSLNAAIKRLRDALDDSAENPRFIETLPRHGYRFISVTPPNAIQPKTAGSLVRRWGLPFVAVAILLVAVLFFAADAGGLRSKVLSHTAAQPPIRSLAVLPLTNISADPEQEYFADGMTEELIGELSRIRDLKVVSRTSVMQYKGEKNKPLPQIARELNVDGIMEGAVLRFGNRVRITAQLIYAPTDQHLMAQTYERDLGDVLKLQGEVAEDIARQVRLSLTPEQKVRLQRVGGVNPEAYEAYLKALSFGKFTRQDIRRAQSYYENALQKDPGFASAYAGLARSYDYLGQFRWLSPQDAYRPGKQAALKALELDPNNCEAHYLLGWFAWRYDWDWPAADRELSAAYALCPSDPEVHWQRAFYSGWSGRAAEARAELAKVHELDSRYRFLLVGQTFIDYDLRDYKSMIDQARQDVASDANAWIGPYLLGVGYEGSGQAPKAIPEYQKAVELSEGDQDPTAALAHAYAVTGRRDEAQKILHEWLRQSETTYVSPYMIATVYAGLGDKGEAFKFLEKAYQERSSDLPYFLKADLRIDNLRSDPRFQDLLRRMNFPK